MSKGRKEEKEVKGEERETGRQLANQRAYQSDTGRGGRIDNVGSSGGNRRRQVTE